MLTRTHLLKQLNNFGNKVQFTRYLSGISLDASPKECLHDEVSRITAQNLIPNYPYTIRAKTYDEKNRMFQACGHFMSDENGNLDLTKHPSFGGDYTGVLPMGLLVGLKPDPFLKMRPMLVRKNIYLPWEINLSIHEGHLRNIFESKGEAEVNIKRHLIKEGVKRIEIKEGRLRGTLFIPPGDGPFPGVVNLPGATLGISESTSCQLASRGFASLVLPYFGYKDLPKTLEKFELEYFIEGIDLMCSFDEIISDTCGVLCTSFSGQFGILLGNYVDKVTAICILNGVLSPIECTVYYKGNQLTTNPYNLKADAVTFDENSFIVMNYNMFKNDLYNKENVILAKNASPSTHFLLMGGSQCGQHTYVGHRTFETEMKKIGKTNIENVVYPGGPHIIDPPYNAVSRYVYQGIWPSKPKHLNTPYKGVFIDHGGEVQATYQAEEDAWKRMITFYNCHITAK